MALFYESLVLATLLLVSSLAHSQSDIMGTAGKFAAETGARGAAANRQVADQLYKQSLQDESNAWKSFPPSVSLLTKALSESKDAKNADDQAKEFARAALHAGKTAEASGVYKAERYGGLSDTQLSDLANKSSPYMAAVESKMGGYGMKLDSDKMALRTPFGKFDVNMSSQTLEKTLISVANSFGFGGDAVSKGMSEAIKTRDQIAAAAEAAVSGRATASVAVKSDVAPPVNVAPAASAPPAAAASESATASAAGAPDSNGQEDIDWDARKRALLENQEAARRRLGLQSLENQSPLGRPEENIFQKVHDRYLILDHSGAFGS